MAHMDRLMADVSRIAVACWWWDMSCMPRVLTPSSPADDEGASDEWEEARGRERDAALYVLESVRDQRAALGLLAGNGPRSATARRHAIHAIERAGGPGAARHVDVHGFGPGWRELPRPVLYPGIVARDKARRLRA